MQEKIKNLIQEALKELGIIIYSFVFDIEHPADTKKGDYSSNVSFKYFGAFSKGQNETYQKEVEDGKISKSHISKFEILFKNLSLKNPRKLAEKITEEINKNLPEEIEKVEVAGPGFINFYLSQKFFINSVKQIVEDEEFGKVDVLKGKKVMVEYTDPNPFKPFHIGHLMSNAIGESISRLVEFAGADVVRANYQGDVGLHVAKAIFGLQEKGLPENSLSVSEQAEYVGECYSFASNLYEEKKEIKEKINAINKKVYERTDEEINKIYDWGREVTLEAFEKVYEILGTKFKHYFFESEMAKIGKELVKENTGEVFEESEGAIVFRGEKHDPKLHTRVFVNKEGLPTYEAKEIGLTVSKFEKESNLDMSVVITAVEQEEYMKVVQKAISLFHPEYEERMKHITHGMMRFASGKMSSRKGNVITGESLIRDVRTAISEKIKDRDLAESEKENISMSVGIAALKYSILKQSIGGDIIYDFESSISFEGDSGPYLQYSYARANSLCKKAKQEGIDFSYENTPKEISQVEKLLYRFPEVIKRSAEEFAPHHITGYLVDLSRVYNAYYGNNKIINQEDSSSPYRVALSHAFKNVLKNGLYLLGVVSPEKM